MSFGVSTGEEASEVGICERIIIGKWNFIDMVGIDELFLASQISSSPVIHLQANKIKCYFIKLLSTEYTIYYQ